MPAFSRCRTALLVRTGGHARTAGLFLVTATGALRPALPQVSFCLLSPQVNSISIPGFEAGFRTGPASFLDCVLREYFSRVEIPLTLLR